MTILFESGFESGDADFSNVAISGNATVITQEKIVHSGELAAKLTIKPSSRSGQAGVRLVYFGENNALRDDPKNLPDEAWYSAWYFLPYVSTSWLNIMQWKQGRQTSETRQARDPVAFIKVAGKKGRMFLSLQHRVSGQGEYLPGSHELAQRPDVEVPIEEWFELISYFRWDKGHDGLIYTTINGQPLWYIAGIQTEYDKPFVDYPREATWNNYAASVSPNPYSLYVDDVKVWSEPEV